MERKQKGNEIVCYKENIIDSLALIMLLCLLMCEKNQRTHHLDRKQQILMVRRPINRISVYNTASAHFHY